MGEEVERVELGPPPVHKPDLTERLIEAAATTGHLYINVDEEIQRRIDEVIARYPKNPAFAEEYPGEWVDSE
jgi:hypothetical protein